MNQKIQSLIDGGFITINDVLEHSGYLENQNDDYYHEQYNMEYEQAEHERMMQSEDMYGNDDLSYEMTKEEIEYERMRMLDDMYGDDEGPKHDGAGFTERDEFPEYIIASTSYKLEETYIFQANENGEIHDFGEYGGLAKRWGDENWTDWYIAVDKTFGEGKYIFDRRIESGNSGVVHMLFRKIEHEQEYPLPSDSWNGSY